jgi:hypothetical protein
MDREKKQNEDLNAFEAAMASLRPAADGLDQRWNDRLAGAAGNLCNHPSGHRFACVYCGAPVPKARGLRHWGWPAATAMTVAAALMLMAILVQLENRIVSVKDTRGEMQPTNIAQDRTKPTPHPSREKADSRVSESLHPLPQFVFDSEKSPYISLRDQTMRFGAEAQEASMLVSNAPSKTKETPLSSRQLLERMLKQQGWNGS